MAGVGDVYSGAAQSFQQAAGNTFNMAIAGANHKAQQEQRALAAEESRQQQAQRDLQMSEMFKKNILEVADEPDPEIRSLAFKSLFKAAEKFTRTKTPDAIRQLASTDPDMLKEVLAGADAEGMTFMDVWRVASDPLQATSAILAFGKSKQNKQTRAALSVGGTPETVPMVSPEEDGQNAALISSLGMRISALRQGLANAAKGGASEAGLKAIQERIKTDEDRMFDLMKSGGTARTNEDAKPVPDSLLAKLREKGEMGEAAYPGVTYGEVRQYYRNIKKDAEKAAAEARKNAPTPTNVEQLDTGKDGQSVVISKGTGTTPTPSAPGKPRSGILSESEEIKFREQQQFRNQAAPVWAQQEYGVTSMGEFQDGLKSGKYRNITADELRRREEAAAQGERVAGKNFEDITTKGKEARASKARAQAMYTLIDQAGETGPWVTPVRNAVNNFVQAISGGNINPKGMDELQMLQQFATKMAIDDLQRVGGNDSDRDFLRALTSNPNSLSTRSANKMMLQYRMAIDGIDEHRSNMAQKWQAKYGSLSQKNPEGDTFEQAWSNWAKQPDNSALSVLLEQRKYKNVDQLYKEMGIAPKKEKK